MKINVLLRGFDALYCHGLKTFIVDYFRMNFSYETQITTNFNRENISRADIIVLSLCAGEPFLCSPELLARKQGGIIGVINDHATTPKTLPICFSDMIFISRYASLADFQQVLARALEALHSNDAGTRNRSCSACQHKGLSRKQTRIMANLYLGKPVMKIADQLGINYKTVCAHKYNIMKKFALHSDYQLLALLTKMAQKNCRPNLLRDYLNEG